MALVFSKEWLNIANRALNLIGESPIQTFNGNSTKNESLNIQLPAAVEAVLSQYSFKCASNRTRLAPEADYTPAFGYSYGFVLPNNFVRIVSVENTNDYKLEGGRVLANDSPLDIIYVKLPENPYSLSHSVIEAITLTLAYKMAMTATTNTTVLNQLRQDSALALAQAIKEDQSGITQDYSMKYWGEYR